MLFAGYKVPHPLNNMNLDLHYCACSYVATANVPSVASVVVVVGGGGGGIGGGGGVMVLVLGLAVLVVSKYDL